MPLLRPALLGLGLALAAPASALAAPSIWDVDVDRVAGGRIVVDVETADRASAPEPRVTVSLGGRRAKLVLAERDFEGARATSDLRARVALPLREGQRVRIAVRACADGCTSITRIVRVGREADGVVPAATRGITATEAASRARTHVGGGRVTSVERTNRHGALWHVEVAQGGDIDADVWLAADGRVLRTVVDD